MSPEELPVVGGGGSLPQMTRPLLLTVHSEPALACGIENHLRREFGPRGYEAMCVDAAPPALDLLRSMKSRSEDAALLVIDQQLGATTGLELIAEARRLHPTVRTILLVDHGDMASALDAINDGSLDYFLVKPLSAPDEQLVPVADDLLDDWQRWVAAGAEAVRVVDHRTPEALDLCRFLDGNDIHRQFLDLDRDAGGRLLLGAPTESVRLPLVVLGDGTRMSAPSTLELARALGLPTRPRRDFYDLVVVGAGPAGLAAAVYGASEGLDTLLVDRDAPGGQAGQSSKIENYLGFPAGLRGSDLAQRAIRQAHRFDAEIVRLCEAAGLEADGSPVVSLSDGSTLRCHALLIATGVTYRRLDAPGIDDLVGRGVYYGAMPTDAGEYAGAHVFIVGGANSAGQAALHFAKHAGKVSLVVRAESLTKSMSTYLVDRILAAENIEVLTRTTVVGAAGEDRLESITLANAAAGTIDTVPADAVFMFIGAIPHTSWLATTLLRDERDFLLTGRDLVADGGRPGHWPLDRDPFPLETNVPGVFVAGDVRHGSTKRVSAAVGEGGMAVQLVHQHLRDVRQRETGAAG
jgi:thioredoxin reductase (NADPH)